MDFERARKINNYDVDATAGGLWIDTTHYRVTCPTGKRWILIGGITNRDVIATLAGMIKDASGNTIDYLVSEGAALGIRCYPELDFFFGQSWILDEAEYIEMVFGAAQGVAAYCSCCVLEIDF